MLISLLVFADNQVPNYSEKVTVTTETENGHDILVIDLSSMDCCREEKS